MRVAPLEPGRRRVLALLGLAVVLLLGRVAADALGAAAVVEQALYGGAVLCLVGCVLVIARDAG
jgi:hypothetical protein